MTSALKSGLDTEEKSVEKIRCSNVARKLLIFF